MHKLHALAPLLCVISLVAPFAGAWAAPSSHSAANVLVHTSAPWSRLQPAQRTVGKAPMGSRVLPRALQPHSKLWTAAAPPEAVLASTATPAPVQQQEQPQQEMATTAQASSSSTEALLKETLLKEALQAEAGQKEIEEADYEWVLSEVMDPSNHSAEITEDDVRLAYECFYNVSVAPVQEGMRILMSHTELFLFKNVSELHTRAVELAPDDHVANLNSGFEMVVAYVESFAESWGKMVAKYRGLLGGAVNATRSSPEALDSFVQQHKEHLCAPGFMRYLDSEFRSAEDPEVQKFLQFLQVRIVNEQEAAFPEELKVISRLLSVEDKAQRESELEYLIRKADDPQQWSETVLGLLKKALKEASGMELLTEGGVEVITLLTELINVVKSVSSSLQQQKASQIPT